MEFGKFLCRQTLGGGSPSCIKGLNGVERREGERRGAKESVGARISRYAR